MRLCRFRLEETVLTGFYADTYVVPLDQAADAYSVEEEVELLLPATEDLLDLLPPAGPTFEPARRLAAWVEELDEVTLSRLAIPIEEVTLLLPIPRPPKIFLMAGNYAAHVTERGGTAAERAETFPYVFMKPPTTLTAPGDP
ncbi:MAG: FAA hydrolase family protein, partial [Isosphaeraceae bacterium]|nr:FAA hydrolase family protein [Isosphaeraceae bacterium]